MSAQKELRRLVKEIEAQGFTVEPSGGGHQKVLFQGKPVNVGDPEDRATWEPVLLPSSPSDPRWRDNTVAMLIRARVLKEDPFRAGQAGLSDEDVEERVRKRAEREQRQQERESDPARQEKVAAESAVAENAQKVHERAAAILGPIGVWKATSDPHARRGEPRRSIGEVARLAFAIAQKRGVDAPPNKNAAEVAIKKFFDGQGMMKNLAWIEALLDDLENAPDPIRRYFVLLREELGLAEGGPPPEGEPVPAEPPAPVGPEPLKVEDEDDDRVRDLRTRLEEEARERRAIEAALETERQSALAARAEMEDELAEAKRLAEDLAHVTNGNGAKIPELAFEVLGEMIGQVVQVAGEDGTADLDAVLQMIAAKKERAVELAKQVAALELGIAE